MELRPLAGSRRQEYGCRVATQHSTSDKPGLAAPPQSFPGNIWRLKDAEIG